MVSTALVPSAHPPAGVRLRLPPRDFAEMQERRALALLRDLVMLLEDDEALLWRELDVLVAQGRAGRRPLTYALRRQANYIKATRRMLKIMESAEARRDGLTANLAPSSPLCYNHRDD